MKDIFITSYLPTYRTPPPPSELIDWNGGLGNGIIAPEISQFLHIQAGDKTVSGTQLQQIARRFLKDNPEYFIYDPVEYKRMYAKHQLQMLGRMVSGWANCSIGSACVNHVCKPDELMDFEYITCTFLIHPKGIVDDMRRYRSKLQQHIDKRFKDPRYKFMKDKKYKSFHFWQDPSNWVGFAAGFVIDYCLYSMLPPRIRHHMWKMPITIFNKQDSMAEVIKVNQNLSIVFTDGMMRKALAEHIVDKHEYQWAYSIVYSPLRNDTTALIKEMCKDPVAYKKQLERKYDAESTAQRQQREILQDLERALNNLSDSVRGRGTEIAGGQPLEDNHAHQAGDNEPRDNQEVGSTAAVEARRELEHRLSELRVQQADARRQEDVGQHNG